MAEGVLGSTDASDEPDLRTVLLDTVDGATGTRAEVLAAVRAATHQPA